MPRSPKLLMVLAATVIVVVAACGGSDGAGSVTLPSSVTRPSNGPTSPGVTEPPAASATTSPPTTEEPIRPTEAPTTGASPTEPATEAPGEDESSTWWPWLLLGVAAVAAVVGVVMFAGSRNKKPPWTANASAAFAQSDEITTHLVGLEPGGLASVASADAARLAALAATVQQLASSAPDNTSMQSMMAMRGPLQSLHAAVDAVTLAPAPPSDFQVDQVRAAATGLHQATSLARANVLPPLRPGM
jgi:hypothetical protein